MQNLGKLFNDFLNINTTPGDLNNNQKNQNQNQNFPSDSDINYNQNYQQDPNQNYNQNYNIGRNINNNQNQNQYPSNNWKPVQSSYNGSLNTSKPNYQNISNQNIPYQSNYNPFNKNYQNINTTEDTSARVNQYKTSDESYYNNQNVNVQNEEQEYCKPTKFKKQNNDTYCYVGTNGNLICNQKSIYCNNNDTNSKCQNNDIQYGIDNRLDSALNTLLNYLNTNSNKMKKNCIPVVKKYIYEWGLQDHLQKYYNLFTRIALDDPSEKARNYFSSNALLIGLMMNIVKSEQEEEMKNINNQGIIDNMSINISQYQTDTIGNQDGEEMRKYPQEERSKYAEEEEMRKYPQEERSKYAEEEEMRKYPQEERNKYAEEEEMRKYPQEERSKYAEEEMRKYPQEEEMHKYPQEERNKYAEEEINRRKRRNRHFHPGEENNTQTEEERKRFDQESKLVQNCKYSNYGCCPDGVTSRYDVQGSNCVKYPKAIQPYSPQDNNYVLNSNQNQRITYLTDPQNPTEIPDTGPFNRTLYLYNENPPVSEEKCPKCPDMSKYIRKDQIPCWGCNLE